MKTYITTLNKNLVKEILPSGKVSYLKCEQPTHNSKTEDLLRLLKRPAKKFIYPAPIYININGKTQSTYSTDHLNQQKHGSKSENLLDNPQDSGSEPFFKIFNYF